MRKMSNAILIVLIFSSLVSYSTYASEAMKSEDDFNQVIKQNSQVVVCFFFKMVRSYTQELMNVLNEIEKDFSHVAFVNVDVRSSIDLARRYSAFLSHDVLVFIKDGQVVERKNFDSDTRVSKDEIVSLINTAFPVESESVVCEAGEVESGQVCVECGARMESGSVCAECGAGRVESE